MMYVNVNGVWRDGKINPTTNTGVVRKGNGRVNINGVWRKINPEITAEEVTGIRVVYTASSAVTCKTLPHLQYNPDIPVKLTTSESADVYSDSPKSILLEYNNDKPNEEGIFMYTGRMYVVKEFITMDIDEVDNINLTMDGFYRYESYGYFTAGWNSFFANKHLLDQSSPQDRELHEDRIIIKDYPVLPAYSRTNGFVGLSMIGIARDATTPDANMIGSHGLLEHSIDRICLNGNPIPFTIEIR